jgi:hypothetical protein
VIRNQGYLNVLSFLNFIYGGIILFLLLLIFLFQSTLYGEAFTYRLFVFAKYPRAGVFDVTPPIFFILEILLWITLSIFGVISGFLLKKQKNYWFSFNVAIMQCLIIAISKDFLKNFSIILGIITIIILLQHPIKKLYDN